MKKKNKCEYCGGGGDSLLFISTGDKAIIRHDSPFECIEYLNFRLKQTERRTAGLATFG